MTATALRNDEDVHAAQRRKRACLKCTETFESAWFGERICRRCKGTSSWQSGGSLVSAGGRSRSGAVRR